MRLEPNRLITPDIVEAPSEYGGIFGDPDDYQYQRSGRSSTEIPEWKIRQAILVSRYLYMFNPFAHRMVEILRDFVVGNIGFEIKADDPKVQAVIDRFWKHHHNRFDQDWIPRYTLSVSVDGEITLPVKVDMNDPVPLFGYVSPLLIRDVRPLPFRPGTAESIVIETAPGKDDLVLPVLGRQTQDELSRMTVKEGGILGAFYMSVNALADNPRGAPDLFVISDDLEQYNRTNWARMRKAEQEGTYLWDVTIQGATEPVIDKFEKEMILKPPRPGGWRVHSDKVTWDTVEASKSGTDASNELRYHRSNMHSTFGIPDFFVSGESGSGRMATSELWSTVIATAGSRQREMKTFIKDIGHFAVHWAIIAGELSPDTDTKLRVTAPVIGIRDLQRMSGMIKNFLESVREMGRIGIIGDDSARGIIRTLLTNLGFELDDEESLGALDFSPPPSGGALAAPGDSTEPKPAKAKPAATKAATNGSKPATRSKAKAS